MLSVPGKTAPRLLEDLLIYEPRIEAQYGRNILTDPPPLFEADSPRRPQVPRGFCRHVYMIKYSQSQIPALDDRPDNAAVYKVASFCQECRCHLDLVIDYRGDGVCRSPCPTEDFPLHHFVHDNKISPAELGETNGDHAKDPPLLFGFRCSSELCRAIVLVGLRPPRIRPEYVKLLTDPTVLEARKEAAVQVDPDRPSEFVTARPIDALEVLYRYLQDSFEQSRPANKRRIPPLNRRFMVTFGRDCDVLLNELGFKYAASTDDADNGDSFWYLPDHSEDVVTVTGESLQSFIQDFMQELLVLIYQRPAGDRKLLKNFTYQPQPSVKLMERILGCLEFARVPSSRRKADPSTEDHPYYASLGTLADFSDDLIFFAYERQVVCDPVNAPYYFECIQDIAQGRRSEALETRVLMLASQGHISRKDVANAYMSFGIDPKQGSYVSDDHIIGQFRLRLPDVGHLQEAEMRNALRTLAQARRSSLIQHAASDSIETYNQALAWLGAQEDTPDEFILTMLTVKVEENPVNEEIGRRAIDLIAQARRSQYLRNWLEKGEVAQGQMEVGEAYSILQIDDRSAILDDDTLSALFGARVSEAPDREAEFSRALAVVKADMELSHTGQHSDGNARSLTKYPIDDWPVGLQNIGNTCYLNSLLQFFFTIEPLRVMVLNVDEYMMKLTHEPLEKRVGGGSVRRQEVERAQAFARELQKIFVNMITAPKSEIVPDRELARLTILKSSEDVSPTDASQASETAPNSLGDIDGAPVLGPVNKLSQGPASARSPNVMDDDASEGTLVADSDKLIAETSSDSTHMDSDSDQKKSAGLDLTEEYQMSDILDVTGQIPLLGAAASETAQTDGTNSMHVTDDHVLPGLSGQVSKAYGPPSHPPPSRPPPMPPRPNKSKPQGPSFGEIENIAQQRDVTEVIGNVLFQLECAIVPTRFQPDGEQWDLIKDLFYGRYTWFPLSGNKIESKEELFDTIIINVASGPTDIYSALDDYFDPHDIQSGNGTLQRFGVINGLPPILQLNISRVMYDRERGSQYKIEHHLKLEETLFLDRYSESQDPELLRRRKRAWQLKQRIQNLKARRSSLSSTSIDMDLPTAIEAASQFISSLQEVTPDEPNPLNEGSEETPPESMTVDESSNQGTGSDAAKNPQLSLLLPSTADLPEKLLKAAAALKDEIAALDTEIATLSDQLSTIFSDLRRIPYRLHSVFIHRGTAVGGHYWVYIFDFDRNLWRCYNDSAVTLVENPERTIFSEDRPDRPGLHPATPNLLVYVREDCISKLVNAVCRQVQKADQETQGNGDRRGENGNEVETVDLTGFPVEMDHDETTAGGLQVINAVDADEAIAWN